MRPVLDAEGVGTHRETSKWDRTRSGLSSRNPGIERIPTAFECVCVLAKADLC